MPLPRAALDPYCFLNGKGEGVRTDDPDENLRMLAAYAKDLDAAVWLMPDNKIGLTSPRYKLGKDGGMFFGQEGASTAQTTQEAFKFLHAQSHILKEKIRLGNAIEEQVINKAFNRVDAPVDPLEIIRAAERQAIAEGAGVVQDIPVGEGGQIGAVTRAFSESVLAPDNVARYVSGNPHVGSIIGSFRPIVNVRVALSRIGPAGRGQAAMYMQKDLLVSRNLGPALRVLEAEVNRVNAIAKKVGQPGAAENGVFQRWVEFDELPPAFEPHRAEFQSIYDNIQAKSLEFYNTMKAMGLDVKQLLEPNPRWPTGRYWPHRWDMAIMKDPKAANQLIDDVVEHMGRLGSQINRRQAQEILDRQVARLDPDKLVADIQKQYSSHGRAITRREAEDIVENFVKPHAERFASSVEKTRRLGVPGYITDMRRAFTSTWTRNAHRIAETQAFGLKDRKLHALMDYVKQHEGPEAHKFVRDVYNLEIGRTRNDFNNSFFREFYNWQAIKLSLAAIANATQQINTPMITGFRPFFLAAGRIGRMRARDVKGLVEESGAVQKNMFGDDKIVRIAGTMLGDMQDQGLAAAVGDSALQASSLPARVYFGLSKNARNFALAAFKWVEVYNRAVGQVTGEIWFDDMMASLGRSGVKGLTANKQIMQKRLVQLGFGPDKVMKVLGFDPKTGARVAAADNIALSEMRTLAGLRVSNLGQFKADIQSSPLIANSFAGKFMFQFKNFAFGQTEFLAKQIFSKNTPLDQRIRTLAMLMTAYPALGIAVTSLRAELMGPTLTSKLLDELLDDPTIGNLVMAAGVGATMAGGWGILADLGMSTIVGNSYVTQQFFTPPATGTIASFGEAVVSGGSSLKSIVTGDDTEWKAFRRAVLSEFGGFGATVDQTVNEWLGEAEDAESFETLGALPGKLF